MKKFYLLLFCVFILTSFTSKVVSTECEVAEFYRGIEAENKTKVITSLGDIEEAEIILLPTEMEEGTFKIEITRKGSNIYKVDGTSYYIETKYCYEYATYDEAILKVESNYGYTKGKIIFNP